MSFTSLEAPSHNRKNYFTKYAYIIRCCLAGILLTLGFAPFHFPGLVIIGLAIYFSELQNKSYKQKIISGLDFGLSFL